MLLYTLHSAGLSVMIEFVEDSPLDAAGVSTLDLLLGFAGAVVAWDNCFLKEQVTLRCCID